MNLSEYIRKEFGIVPDEVQLQEIKDLANSDSKENKAELINALFNVLQNSSYTDLKIIAETNLKKLLESL